LTDLGHDPDDISLRQAKRPRPMAKLCKNMIRLLRSDTSCQTSLILIPQLAYELLDLLCIKVDLDSRHCPPSSPSGL